MRRCLALAAALAPWADCRFLLDVEQPAARLVRTHGWPCDVVGHGGEALLRATEALPADALVVDSYTVDVPTRRALHDGRRLLVAIDDGGDGPVPADLVIDTTRHPSPLSTRADGYLLGPGFALLSPEFAAEPVREGRARPARVLLTLGGTMPPTLAGALAGAARSALPHVVIDVVIGPGADRPSVELALRPIDGLRVHVSPDDMRGLMLRADLAVTAGGVTLLELAATGMPSVGLALADNQRGHLVALARAGAAVFAGDAGDPGLPAAVEGALRDLASDAPRRRAVGERARMVVDGRGAARVAAAIRARLTGRLTPAAARP